ncbi:CocE/NonD family hydrolase [Mycolicibacterium bacteremicum]|uniref:S15 peptidase family protein n=1 Tax=Mycolicibacterium bacteremicum TaxID=564198 RepID=UPI0026EB3EB7|nr:CocE/NonD family hydrolase [Mycolicibacterium bacteremicum]
MTRVSTASYIGRVGGLAAALGIGTAVLCGTGIASAAPAETDGSRDTTSTAGESAPSSGAADTTDAERPANTEKPASPVPKKKPVAKKKPRAVSVRHDGNARTEPKPESKPGETRPAESRPGASEPGEAEPAETTKPTRPDEPAPDESPAEMPGAEHVRPADTQPVDSASAAPESTDPVVFAPAPAADVPPALVRPRTVRTAGTGPTAPIDTPLSWTMLAAASRNTLAPSAGAAVVIDPVTNAPVIATPKTPLLEPLQRIPVLGPLFVTPIVAIINQIPVVSDLLHPIVGYPLEWGRPAGTPRPRDVMLTSFDGTRIYAHFMPAAGLKPGEKAATILQGPGLLLPGATNLGPTLLDGIITDTSGLVYTGTLRAAGYNVVTWDPRGEHSSGGRLEQDSPDFDAKDVSTIISWVATQPEARLDPGVLDPRIGMTGASYGGGIQLVSAATDPRIDAIVPAITWNTLNTATYKNQAFKSSWAAILTAGITLFTRPNPAILPATIYGVLTGRQTAAEQARLAQLGPGGPRDLVGKITAPTLLIQGTVDTLFSLQEADTTASTLIANGVPTKVIWYCGGHGLCGDLFDPTDGMLIQRATLAWLDRYVNGNTAAVTGPQFEFVDQRGQFYASENYPTTPGTAIESRGSGGLLPLLPFLGGSGPMLGVIPFGASKAANALNLRSPVSAATTHVVGAPQLTLSYSGTGTARHVYAQLVDNSTGRVLGNQITPIPVTLDGQPHSISIALEPVAHTLHPGQTVTVQLVASSTTYATLTSFGSLRVTDMRLSLPTVDPATLTPLAS